MREKGQELPSTLKQPFAGLQAMAGPSPSDILPVIQSVVLISALVVTLYFSRLQVRAQKANLEAAALASLDEKQHHLTEIFMEDPALLKVLVDAPTLRYAREESTAWYALSIFRYAFHMKERRVLSGDEWEGVLVWMKNAFKHGTLGKYWKEAGYEGWFDPSFRDFVNKELFVSPK